MTDGPVGWGGVTFPSDALQVDVVNVPTADLSPLSALTDLEVLRVDWTDPHRRPPSLPCDLGPLAGLTRLRVVALPGFRVRDLGPLAGLTALEQLDVSGAEVDDLAPLAGLPLLRDVVIDGCPVNDLSPLAGVHSLRRLSARGTAVDPEGFDRFRAARPDVDVVVDDGPNLLEDPDLFA